MRRVIVSNVMSLDGFVSGPNGELDWFVYAGFVKGTEFGEYARTVISSVDSILLGRLTYEEFSSYWPTAKNDDPVITRKNQQPTQVRIFPVSETSRLGRLGNCQAGQR